MEEEKHVGVAEATSNLRMKLMMEKKLWDKIYYSQFGKYVKSVRNKGERVRIIKDCNLAAKTAMEAQLVFGKPISAKLDEDFCFEWMWHGMFKLVSSLMTYKQKKLHLYHHCWLCIVCTIYIHSFAASALWKVQTTSLL